MTFNECRKHVIDSLRNEYNNMTHDDAVEFINEYVHSGDGVDVTKSNLELLDEYIEHIESGCDSNHEYYTCSDDGCYIDYVEWYNDIK